MNTILRVATYLSPFPALHGLGQEVAGQVGLDEAAPLALPDLLQAGVRELQVGKYVLHLVPALLLQDVWLTILGLSPLPLGRVLEQVNDLLEPNRACFEWNICAIGLSTCLIRGTKSEGKDVKDITDQEITVLINKQMQSYEPLLIPSCLTHPLSNFHTDMKYEFWRRGTFRVRTSSKPFMI